MLSRTFGRFLIVGVVNTMVGYGVILGLQYLVGFGPHVANVGGYLIGWIVSYVLNRRFTFGSDRRHREGLPLFLSVALVSYAFNALVLEIALRSDSVAGPLAQAIAMAAYTLCFFQLSRHVAFRRRARTLLGDE
jgi:putative flippase GtrA